MFRILTLQLFALSFINAQIALPTFHGVHNVQNTLLSSNCSGSPETPWGSNCGGISGINNNWNYLMGYKFTPQADGCITKLGGYFDGDKVLRLWKISNGELLAKVTVSDPNYSWAYAEITSVSVTAGEQYYVGGFMAGSGAAYKSGVGLPKTYGNIKIDYNCWAYNHNSDTYPSSFGSGNQTNWLHGMVDITFVPE